MTAVRIVLAEALPAFRPGEIVEGHVEAETADALDGARIHLGWRTEGEGRSEEPEVVHVDPIDAFSTPGRYSFRLELPEGPWSFEGRLFSVHWQIEVVRGGESLAGAGIIVSPTGQALRPSA